MENPGHFSVEINTLGSGRGILRFVDPSIEPKSLSQTITIDLPVSGGNVLQTRGWPAGLPAMASGDFVTIGAGRESRLHQVAFDAAANMNGIATLTVFPALRRAQAAGTALEVNQPHVLLRPNAPVPTRIERGARHRFTLSAREAL